MATTHETYTATRLTVEVPGVREFQQQYEQAVPANPAEEIAALVQRGASWPASEFAADVEAFLSD
jgi:hypothetical protein